MTPNVSTISKKRHSIDSATLNHHYLHIALFNSFATGPVSNRLDASIPNYGYFAIPLETEI
jgi:hypothetical protein